MNDRTLEYIEYIAEYKSILKASEKLFVSSSALSKFVQKTESDLNLKIFDRVGKRFVLTYAGERYLSWLKKIETVNNEMNLEMSDLAHSRQGRLRVGVQLSGSDHLIYDILPTFYHKFPQILVDIYEESSGTICRMLEDNELDIAIIPDNELSENIHSLPLTRNHRVLIAPPDHPLLEKSYPKEGYPYLWVDYENFQNESFVAPFSIQRSYGIFQDLTDEYHFHPKIVAHLKNLSSILKCVYSGIGLTLSPDHIVKSNLAHKDLLFFSYSKKSFINNLVIAHHKDHYLDHSTTYFIELWKSIYPQ